MSSSFHFILFALKWMLTAVLQEHARGEGNERARRQQEGCTLSPESGLLS
jgi:hypothetical protein